MNIGIVGAGATGLTAGYELLKKGYKVTIFEAGKECGGLVGTIDAGDEKLEQFYHHIFNSDNELIDIIDELGLSDELMWISPKNGIYLNNKMYPFTSPLDLLLFKELSPIERISLGLLIYKAKYVKNWKDLENITAREWIIRKAGRNVYDKVWGPLLYSKFDLDSENISAAWIWNKFKLRGSTRGKNLNKELLGYMKGSFGTVYKKLAQKIIEQGGEIVYSKAVTAITQRDDKRLDMLTGEGTQTFDKVIVTTAPEILIELGLGLPQQYKENLSRITYKANICMVLELSEQLCPYYWVTVADKNIPFVAVIEHTNLVPANDYKSHIVYLSRYIDVKNKLFSAPDEEIKQLFINSLKEMFPLWDEAGLKRYHISRAAYAQPVVFTGYSKILPDFKTPVNNLYLASMAQIYPEDRGQNYSIRMGRRIAELLDRLC
jgi:protoporphyrinogen oxidase